MIELHRVKDRSRIVAVSDLLIADREKYLTKAKHIFFVVYQTGKIIIDENGFCSPIERRDEASIRLITGRSTE